MSMLTRNNVGLAFMLGQALQPPPGMQADSAFDPLGLRTPPGLR
jgi:hypothetical protein